jgi:hypothetical protein
MAKAQHLAAVRGVEVDWVLADLRTYQLQPLGYRKSHERLPFEAPRGLRAARSRRPERERSMIGSGWPSPGRARRLLRS